MTDSTTKKPGFSRRGFLKTAAVSSAAIAMPHLWIPNTSIAQTSAHGAVKHVLYIRLSGGFRFTTGFNGDVADQYNPFGLAAGIAGGTEWGVPQMLESSPWLNEERTALGMQSIPAMANQIAVLPCVDHEPFSGSADGNHGTGLERYLTGYVGGDTSIFTMINYGLRARTEQALITGDIALPSFVLGNNGMARGGGNYAAYRPPVISGGGFDQFGFSNASLPNWAQDMTVGFDERMRDRQHPDAQAPIDAYIQTRDATERYSDIFNSEVLRTNQNSDELIDGLSNNQLTTMFGNDGAARNVRLALRLFHFGAPAVYLDQGGYDMHSGEENSLPGRMQNLGHLISAIHTALKTMQHPSGGTYWDHTLVAFGSEFGRTARGNRFNSARGSDHGGDLATRWMSMPIMGGVIEQAGNGGRSFGRTRPADLTAEGTVYSYRSVCKTIMDSLGCDHREFFPADVPFNDLFA